MCGAVDETLSGKLKLMAGLDCLLESAQAGRTRGLCMSCTDIAATWPRARKRPTKRLWMPSSGRSVPAKKMSRG